MTLKEYAESLGTPLFPAQLALIEAIQRGETVRNPRRAGAQFVLKLAKAWMEHEA